MSLKNRTLSYSLAINEALHQIMTADERVFLIGQGVKSPWYVGNTTQGLLDQFGKERVIDTPVSENCITGAAIGAAIAGMRPIIVHPRLDFMLYAFDPIINEAANWYYMFGGKLSVPVVIWGIVNRGGEQAAQHSQALYSIFVHIPGLKVVMPSNSYDAKGLLISAVLDDNPVLYIDDRWLYKFEANVPEEIYTVDIGKGIIRKEGEDVTIVSSSYLVNISMKAAIMLEEEGIKTEVIDLRSLKPMDQAIIFNSVKKTGRLVVVDGAWKTCGFAAEISTLTVENVFDYLKVPIVRVTLPDVPAPASSPLEEEYYINEIKIVNAIKNMKGI